MAEWYGVVSNPSESEVESNVAENIKLAAQIQAFGTIPDVRTDFFSCFVFPSRNNKRQIPIATTLDCLGVGSRCTRVRHVGMY
jgi:hypothetical protein